MDGSLLQTNVPQDLEKILHVESQSSTKAKASTERFLKNSLQHHSKFDLSDMLSHKAVVLGYARPKKDKSIEHKKAKGLNARQKRAMKIFQIKEKHQSYEVFLPLHELWRRYIIDLCGGLKPTSNLQFVQQKFLKADFHGAVITVISSTCPSYVGTTGIVVQEFKHVFKLITKENRFKVIPKRNCVFSVEINGFVSNISGCMFEQRASERATKKFKVRRAVDL